MNLRHSIERRRFLRAAGASILAAASGTATWATPQPDLAVRIAGNPGPENATLNALLAAKGFLDQCGVRATFLETPGPSGPLRALVEGHADICLVSGYNRIIPDIESGAAVRIVAGAMLPPAHAIYSSSGDVNALEDLLDRDVGVGEINGLLHALLVLRLRKAGIDPAGVRFRNRGSNAEVYAAITAGDVDAGIASISNLPSSADDGVRVVAGGELWKDLKEYTFQTAYAAETALRSGREALVRTLAACRQLYQFLHSPLSRLDFLAARRSVQDPFDVAAAEFTWQFVQENRPYAVDLVLSEARLDYLQSLNLSLGLQRQILPMAAIADMSLARDALDFLNAAGASHSNFDARR